MKKEDLLLVLTPFVLTALFLVVGYNILIQSTPEARVNLAANQNVVEFLDSKDVEPILPKSAFPDEPHGPIVTIPQNQASLKEIIEQADREQATVIYLIIPVQIEADDSLKLIGADSSNEQNLMNWSKKLIATAHQEGYQVITAVTFNATQTITNAQTFALTYSNFIEEWASMFNNYGVSSFTIGISLGHPLYSQISETDMSKLVATVVKKIESKYAGRLGINVCCTKNIDFNLSEFSYLVAIPTPEFPFFDMNKMLSTASQTYNLDKPLYYNRDKSQITDIQP